MSRLGMPSSAIASLMLVALTPATAEYISSAAVIVDMDAVKGPAPAMLGGLRRHADLGFRFDTGDGQLSVARVEPESAAAAAGLEEGDIIVAINGIRFPKPHIGGGLLVKLNGDTEMSLVIQRETTERTLAFVPPPQKWERVTGVEAEYGVLEIPDGAMLRTIITRPKGTDSALAAVFMIQWVGCSSLEFQHEGPWLMVYKAVAEKSGMAMIRVERSANGDSEGPACHELDMDTEIAHYNHAWEELTSHPWIDAERVVIMGNSLGTRTVPIVAQGKSVAGVITSSGGALTYFERMVNFDRHALSHEDRDPREAHDILTRQMPFQVMYLLEGKTPEEIVAERPDLEGVWETIAHTGDGHHYGRPYAYHHQAAKKDYLEAWTNIDAPILVNFNEFDQFEELRGAELIVDTVNLLRPGTATLSVHEKLGHSFRRYPSQLDAYAYRNYEPGQQPVIKTILNWLDENGLNR